MEGEKVSDSEREQQKSVTPHLTTAYTKRRTAALEAGWTAFKSVHGATLFALRRPEKSEKAGDENDAVARYFRHAQ